uniref:hypothetical protein n=1 Tax=Flavobacterium sp. TaxID=239 RepID=UPI00404A58D5
MKYLITLFIILVANYIQAQDYYEIQTEKHVVYNYPKNIDLTVTDENGSTSKVALNKRYKEISIIASWYENPKVYKNAKITLVKRNDPYYETVSKPKLLEKKIEKSSTIENTFTLKAVFSNGLIFEFIDGKVSAKQNDINLEIKNQYLVQTNEGLFKISFYPNNGEFWYVIEQ